MLALNPNDEALVASVGLLAALVAVEVVLASVVAVEILAVVLDSVVVVEISAVAVVVEAVEAVRLAIVEVVAIMVVLTRDVLHPRDRAREMSTATGLAELEESCMDVSKKSWVGNRCIGVFVLLVC